MITFDGHRVHITLSCPLPDGWDISIGGNPHFVKADENPLFRRGAPTRYDWEALEQALEEKIYGTSEEKPGEGWPDPENVAGWQKMADVIRWLAQQAKRGGAGGGGDDGPVESTLRGRAEKMLRKFEKNRGKPK